MILGRSKEAIIERKKTEEYLSFDFVSILEGWVTYCPGSLCIRPSHNRVRTLITEKPFKKYLHLDLKA